MCVYRDCEEMLVYSLLIITYRLANALVYANAKTLSGRPKQYAPRAQLLICVHGDSEEMLVDLYSLLTYRLANVLTYANARKFYQVVDPNIMAAQLVMCVYCDSEEMLVLMYRLENAQAYAIVNSILPSGQSSFYAYEEYSNTFQKYKMPTEKKVFRRLLYLLPNSLLQGRSSVLPWLLPEATGSLLQLGTTV